MNAIGFDKPLYILPFDHRGSFQAKLFGWSGILSAEQTGQVSASKQVIYDGFLAAVQSGVPVASAGILVDEQFGAGILRDARTQGYITACPAEKSGQREFTFEYGDEFAKHIEAMQPKFCKVLVRYNPQADKALNLRQATRLRTLSEYLHYQSQSHFMFELLVPSIKAESESLRERSHYDQQVRPLLMAEAIEELQDAGVEPDVWKVEGLASREDCERIVKSCRRGGRDKVSCIVLGHGEEEKAVDEWLAVASGVPGYIGFAVGRTTFWQALKDWREGRIGRQEAVIRIARRYQEFVRIFQANSHALLSGTSTKQAQ